MTDRGKDNVRGQGQSLESEDTQLDNFWVDELTFSVFIDFIDLSTFINLRTLAAPSDPPACLVFAPKKSVLVESHKADITNRSNMFHPSYQNVDSKANILSKISTMKSPTENDC